MPGDKPTYSAVSPEVTGETQVVSGQKRQQDAQDFEPLSLR